MNPSGKHSSYKLKTICIYIYVLIYIFIYELINYLVIRNYPFLAGVEIIWAMKDKHMTAHFIDPGAAEFMQPELLREKDEGPTISKRRKYTVEHSSQVQKLEFLF